MVISDIIVISLSNTYSKDYMIEGAEIVKEKRFTDFFADEYPFLSACEGAVYMIAPDARNESIYDLEFLDLPEDGSLRIIWLVQDVKRSVLEIIRDLLIHADEPVYFLAHLQGYEQGQICLELPSFEYEFEEDEDSEEEM